MERKEFVDKRDLIKSKKRDKKAGDRKDDRKKRQQEREAENDDEKMSENDDVSVDAELEKELEEDLEAKNPELLDETVFNKFATGELDLPESEAGDLDESDDEADEAAAEDLGLEELYEELGIDPAEMHEKRAKKSQDATKKKQQKVDDKKEKFEAAKRERNQIVDAMMQKAKDEPNIKNLMRII